MPPKGVLIPLALLTAALEKEALTGNEPKNEPTMLHIPTAAISCEASTTFPRAKNATSKNQPDDGLLGRTKRFSNCNIA